ncbi:7-cyano-7-deazaguanine synthase, partial [Stenotrophomonas maltophilia]|uniref:7-cyano-7-deazaguanine synthase n=1 Tax=Stenotrophomonas maltophilia TaxID=40324 RepID=UPI001954F4EE
AETWALTKRLGGQPLIDLIREQSHSCYLGDRTHHHPWGFGCGTCPACQLRAEGYRRFVAAAV